MMVAIIYKTCEIGADFSSKVIACCAVFCDLFYQCGRGNAARERKKFGRKKSENFFWLGEKRRKIEWSATQKTARFYPDCPACCAAANSMCNMLLHKVRECCKGCCSTDKVLVMLFVAQATRHEIVQHFQRVAVAVQHAVYGFRKGGVYVQALCKIVDCSGGLDPLGHHAKAGGDLL